MSEKAPHEFSIALGGPLYQLMLKAGLLKPPLDLLPQRMAFFIFITWIPLLLLSVVDRVALSTAVAIPFLRDFDAHVRFLVALPLMIYAEVFVHQRLRPLVDNLRDGGVLPPEERPKFDSVVASALKLRNSVLVEVLGLLFVFFVGHFVWRESSMLQQSSWYFLPSGEGSRISKAGWWYASVSLPVFQFILIRWYFRFFVWTRFLWHVSKLKLHLVPTHPDTAGGIGFLEASSLAFVPLLLAHGSQIAGILANRIFYEGQSLLAYRTDVAAIVIFLTLAIFAPLVLFTPRLASLRRKSLERYGVFSFQYVDAFDRKWIGGQADKKETLLGSADIQSLADLSNSFQIIRAIRPFPISRSTLLTVVLCILAPIAPLVLTLVPLEQLINRMFSLLF